MGIELVFFGRHHYDHLFASTSHTMILAKSSLLSTLSREFRKILLKDCFTLT